MQEIQDQTGVKESENQPSSTVVSFPTDLSRSRRNREPCPTDEEMIEYRKIRPVLMDIIRQWPALMREWESIATTCPLAKKILSRD